MAPKLPTFSRSGKAPVVNLEELVEAFASDVAAQTDAMERGRPGTGNRHARRYSAAFEKLRAQGDAGMSAFASLLTHPRADVRTSAASYLLAHGHHAKQAQAVLEELSQGEDLNAFGAAQALKRWKEKSAAPEGEHVIPMPPRRPRLIQPRPHPSQPLQLPASLAPHRTLLKGALTPCFLFDKTQGSDRSRGCRYGGLPLVPAGTRWPRSPEGPLHFLGQLDFEELAAHREGALSELPEKGLLAFFYDVENQPWGQEPTDRAFWHLVYVPPDVEPVPLLPPEELMEAERPILPARRLIPTLGFSLPDWWDLHRPAEFASWSDEEGDDFFELRRKLAGGENVDQVVDQVRGHPSWIQDDARIQAQLNASGSSLDDSQSSTEEARLKREAAQWNLLWQIGSDEELGLVWGSSGALYVLIRDEDLRARRFERAWLILQTT